MRGDCDDYEEHPASVEERQEALWRMEEEKCMNIACTHSQGYRVEIVRPAQDAVVTTFLCAQCLPAFLANPAFGADEIVRVSKVDPGG